MVSGLLVDARHTVRGTPVHVTDILHAPIWHSYNAMVCHRCSAQCYQY